MNREETVGVLSVLRGAYPGFYRGITKSEAIDTVNLWSAMFAADDVRLVTAAVQALIASDVKGYPPHIGAVKEQMRRLTATDELDEAAAWATIRAAISNGLYGATEEFAKLPPLCQKIVGSPSQLRDWAACDSDEIATVVASNFQRAFRSVQQREQEKAKLPPSVQTLIEGLSDRLALES